MVDPPCPVGYKYGGLAIQGEGWATDRQLFTLKKYITVRELKLCPSSKQTDWNRLGQCKTIKEMRYNIR
jgi:hypothetical protein